ncbi:transporter substrate-binding domain-containing protein [Devosia salina]|uniref:Transporter substrate-binding domain-containing protein n=1 Tax=Devosia salina TaxID=2860336 RepID=A0ABX8W9J6_9HYPH|nr:transporter substrate-binding domain-containing protein [Devosia salina]QYO75640.1 transporter substrate-binding domain-containing protein [Devosia salina]
MQKFVKVVSAVAVATALFTGLAHADSALERIQAAGKVRIAMDLGVPPWAYKDANLENTGSEVATAKLLAEDLGVELEIVPTTGANRIPFLLSNKADIVLSTLGITEERKGIILYSIPYSGANNVVAAPKSIEIKGFEDLSGKSIAVTRGTMLDTAVTAGAPADANIVRFEDEATTMTAVVTNQVDIIGQTESLIGQINQQNPSKDLESKFVLTTVYYGIAMPLGDTTTKAWLDEWVRTNLANGKLGEIYKTYQNAEIPAEILKGEDR